MRWCRKQPGAVYNEALGDVYCWLEHAANLLASEVDRSIARRILELWDKIWPLLDKALLNNSTRKATVPVVAGRRALFLRFTRDGSRDPWVFSEAVFMDRKDWRYKFEVRITDSGPVLYYLAVVPKPVGPGVLVR